MKALFSICLVILTAISLSAQDVSMIRYSDTCNRCISVMGYASRKIEPNAIYLKFKVSESNKKSSNLTIKETEKKINTILKTLNIPIDNLSTISISGYENFNFKNLNELAYIQNRGYILKLNNTEQVDEFINSSNDLTLDDMQIVKFDNDEILKFARGVQIEAFKNGKNAAIELLALYGEECAEVLNIKEVQAHVIWPNVYGQSGNLNYSVFVSEKTFYELNQIISKFEQEITFEYQVQLTFKIK